MKRVVVDPISRIEGHLRVEIKVDEASGKGRGTHCLLVLLGAVSNLLLKIAILVTFGLSLQRICGVCTTTHALAALRAVEDALGITIPKMQTIFVISCIAV